MKQTMEKNASNFEDSNSGAASYGQISNLSSNETHNHARNRWVRFWVRFCPFLSTFVHMHKQQRPPKLEAFALKTLNLALYARGDSNPQPCILVLKVLFMFLNIYLSNSQSRSSQPRVEARPKPDPADCFVLRSPNSRQGHWLSMNPYCKEG